MFELCHLRCEYVELHAPSSFGLDELLLLYNTKPRQIFSGAKLGYDHCLSIEMYAPMHSHD